MQKQLHIQITIIAISMKRVIVIIIMSLLLMSGCEKAETVEFPEEKVDITEYLSKYVLTDIYVEGNERAVFDLNNDGTTGFILSEFKSIKNFSSGNNWDLKFKGEVYSDSNDAPWSLEFVGYLPIQAWMLSDDGKRFYDGEGDTYSFSLTASCDEKGNISFGDPFQRSSFWPETQYLTVEFVSLEPDKIALRVPRRVYDYETKEFRDIVTISVFEKVL